MGAKEEFKKLMGKKKVNVNSYVYSIKEEYLKEFRRLMDQQIIKMERFELGGDKEIHKLDDE